jgi:hypothetical protein
VIVLSALNFQLNRLHQNRADAHAKVAGSIREDFQLRLWGHATAIAGSPEFFREKFRTIKRGNLELTWNYVPVFFGLAGFGLVILGACELAGCCKP